ncbi:Hypothetical protein Minf_0609 [Methylacidiphilum infernorum V4]|uniref:Uncharacterized protein n=1 Tax=Methylacidiphilum infernorum (isolate V4) TaxID=481448 RepID=B3E006_METI4|nr:Hypothetical protein Minf_0609 [Methylacidiphilum infernorum V4]
MIDSSVDDRHLGIGTIRGSRKSHLKGKNKTFFSPKKKLLHSYLQVFFRFKTPSSRLKVLSIPSTF